MLDFLDRPDPAHHREGQTPEQHKLRAAYIDATLADLTATLGTKSTADVNVPEFRNDVDQIANHAKQLAWHLMLWAGISSIMFNCGACSGIYLFSYLAHWLGRRPTFAICFIAAAVSTASAFAFMSPTTVTIGPITLFRDVFWLVPIMGFCQLSLFGGYAIYFPELFPTRLRSTGTSFCYNVGRFAACSGPLVLGQLTAVVFKNAPEPLRPSGLAMCSIFVVGLMVLPFLPETRGQPLPE